MTDLDPDSPVPLYRQVADILAARIASGEIRSRLPSHRTLVEEFGVSHVTAERVMEELRAEGLIVTVTGKGSYVKRD